MRFESPEMCVQFRGVARSVEAVAYENLAKASTEGLFTATPCWKGCIDIVNGTREVQ